MRPFRVFAGVVLVAALAGYVTERRRSSRRDAEGDAGSTTSADAGRFSPRLPEALEQQVEAAFEADARRRQERFREAIEPGRALAHNRAAAQRLEAIASDASELYAVGAELFHHRFTRAEGFGARDLPALGRVHRGARGGPDAYACADCHRRGGPAGSGDAVDNAYLDGDGERPASALERNPKSLAGLGVIELLAREMTRELRHERDSLIDDARRAGKAITIELVAKGVSFGELGCNERGELDYRRVRGVDPNLEVKPFGWKGHSGSLRSFVEDELALHHGIQTESLVAARDVERVGPFGGGDPDGDGVSSELTGAQLTLLVAFLAMQEVPTESPPSDTLEFDLYARGAELFGRLGCATCHVPSLPLGSAAYALEDASGRTLRTLDLLREGGEPRLRRGADGTVRAYLYSDLKRHVMGPNLREARRYRGVSEAAFVTPPLWGIARSRPYLHDGSAPTLEDAILAHSGEALESQKAFAALDEPGRAPLRVFLTALTRARRVSLP